MSTPRDFPSVEKMDIKLFEEDMIAFLFSKMVAHKAVERAELIQVKDLAGQLAEDLWQHFSEKELRYYSS